eukprot:3826579-Rhodomonas_salina.1
MEIASPRDVDSRRTRSDSWDRPSPYPSPPMHPTHAPSWALVRASAANRSMMTAEQLQMDTIRTRSRFGSEFEEQGLVGSGGFGKVYRVHHYVSDKEYAIKKIVIRRSNMAEIESMIRCVGLLAHSLRAHCAPPLLCPLLLSVDTPFRGGRGQTGRSTGRQTDAGRQAGRQTDTLTETERDRERQRETDTETAIHTKQNLSLRYLPTFPLSLSVSPSPPPFPLHLSVSVSPSPCLLLPRSFSLPHSLFSSLPLFSALPQQRGPHAREARQPRQRRALLQRMARTRRERGRDPCAPPRRRQNRGRGRDVFVWRGGGGGGGGGDAGDEHDRGEHEQLCLLRL